MGSAVLTMLTVFAGFFGFIILIILIRSFRVLNEYERGVFSALEFSLLSPG